jgi:uncharacterized protein involved in type VI secretion and phage assembly
MEEDRNEQQDTAKRLSGIDGLHRGKVTQLDGDPLGENRIQVEIPILNGSDNMVWARLANLLGSNIYGTHLLPEVGDEVVLGFFNNDPCQAVILGSLCNRKQKPLFDIIKGNDTTTIQTKSEIKMVFDEGKKCFTIETPDKNMLTVSYNTKGITLVDQNKNKIVMDSKGITVESEKDLTLKAKMNIVIDAGIALTMKGMAKAEISTVGQMVVKGAMVQIN